MTIFFAIILPPPISTLFPYTTLFRSRLRLHEQHGNRSQVHHGVVFVNARGHAVECGALVTGQLRADEAAHSTAWPRRSEEHTSELQSQSNLVCRLLLEKKKKTPSRQL